MVGVSHSYEKSVRHKVHFLTDRFTKSLISASVKKTKSQLVTHYEINPAHSFLGKKILRMVIREMQTEKGSKEDSSKLFVS